MAWQNGGGGGYPGVTSDGQGGLLIRGGILQEPPAGMTGSIDAVNDDAGAMAFQVSAFGDGNGVDVEVGDGTQVGQFILNTSSQSNALFAFAIANALGRVLNLMSDGTIKTSASLAVWGHAAPAAQPLLATGASATVDDVITLLQSYGICTQA